MKETLTYDQQIQLVDAGFVGKLDCNGELYYSHESGIVVRLTERAWIFNKKLGTARRNNK